jgi:hypothetical protein
MFAVFSATLFGADMPHWERSKGTLERYTLVGAPGECEVRVQPDKKEVWLGATEKVEGVSYDHDITVARLEGGKTQATEQFHTLNKIGLYSKATSGPRLLQKYCFPYTFLLPLSVRQRFNGGGYEIPTSDPIWQEVIYDSGDYDKGYVYRKCTVKLRKDRQGVTVVSHNEEPFSVDSREITDETITISKDGEKVNTSFKLGTVYKDRNGAVPPPEGLPRRYVFSPFYQPVAHALPKEAQDLFFGEFGLGKEPVK